MARGSWEDFTSKWGFGDGDASEGRDFEARDIFARMLNKILAEDIRAVPYDRPGVHNSCLIIFLRVKSRKEPSQRKLQRLLDASWSSGTAKDKEEAAKLEFIPDHKLKFIDEDTETEDLISAAYWKADQKKKEKTTR